jgi:hypothetical protein
MTAWIKKSRVPPTRENSKLIQPVRKPTVKRSLLHPLASKRNRIASEELLWSASSENLSVGNATASIKSNKSAEMINTAPLIQENDQLTDVISAAHALLPNQQFSANATTPSQQQNKYPYEHIDTPGRPRQTSQSTNEVSLYLYIKQLVFDLIFIYSLEITAVFLLLNQPMDHLQVLLN